MLIDVEGKNSINISISCLEFWKLDAIFYSQREIQNILAHLVLRFLNWENDINSGNGNRFKFSQLTKLMHF
jgi:hypothetical protein